MPRMLMFLSLAFVCAACQQADRDVPAAVSADEQDIPVHVTPSVAYEHACADCHGSDGGKLDKRQLASYPQFDSNPGELVTLQDRI